MSYNLKYNKGTREVKVTVYTYSGNKYAKITKNSVTKWFKVEPIRWRVSYYGATSPSGNYGDYRTKIKVISDRVLFFGAVTTQKTKEGWNWTESEMYNNINESNGKLNFSYSTTNGEANQSFGAAGQQNKVDADFVQGSGLRVYAWADAAKGIAPSSDLRAKCSDMVAFMLGIEEDSYCDYWSRDLKTLNNGVIVTKTGTQKSCWLNTVKGVRFAMTMSEGCLVY